MTYAGGPVREGMNHQGLPERQCLAYRREKEMLLEKRWLRGGLFLSLDMTRPFFAELWVPIETPESFQMQIREFLGPLVTKKSYWDNQSALGYALMEWFHRIAGSDDFARLDWWMRNVMVLEGSDRLAETVWAPISFQVPPRFDVKFFVPEWISKVMREVQSDQRSQRQLIGDKTDALEDQKPSDWDERMFALQDSSADAIVTKITLIVEYNIFLGVWELHCAQLTYSNLFELWKWGEGIALGLGMDDLEVPFPGGWRFEVAAFLSRFASRTG
jgi:hypothetical protein